MEISAKIPISLEERLAFGEAMKLEVSWEEFLDVLEKVEYRIEYDEGQIFSFMGYGSEEHEKLSLWMGHLLLQHLPGAQYSVFGSNLPLFIPGFEPRYYNADCVVVEGEPQRVALRGVLTAVSNPVLLVEVLSASTRLFDLGQKFFQYRNLPSLRQILFVDGEKKELISYTRQNGGSDWLLQEITHPENTLAILGLFELSGADIFR